MKRHTKDNHTTTPSRHKPNTRLLDLYIRNNKKQALLVHISPQTQLQHIARAIHARFGIPVDNQVLFHNGRTLNSTNTHNLQDKAIVHVVDSRNITPQITINVRRLNIPASEQFTISSSQLIEDFIVRNIRDEEPDKMFFVYTGRHLDRRRSFAEEFVESESQLFCLHEERDEVKGERRQKYQKIIEQQAAKKQEPVDQAGLRKEKCEGNDSGLQSYLPKTKASGQQDAETPINQGSQVQGTAPNFKKKNISKEINLSSNELNIRQAPHSEQNLSLMVQNNLQQNKSQANSGFFNEGSSISQIVPQQGHNPQNSKKNEEGIMFQSAFIGFNNQNSFVNQNQAPSRVNSAHPSEEQEMSEQSEKSSFSFDVKAPELINLPPDRHLTLIERQILQVTQSEQLSRQNAKESVQNYEEEQDKREYQKERDRSIQNCQFQLGQIENHELSASAEMKVVFNQKESPTRKAPKSSEILIQDDNNDSLAQCSQKENEQLLTIKEDFKMEQQKSNLEHQNQPDSEQEQHRGNDKMVEERQPSQLKRNDQLESEQLPSQNVDIYLIQQENAGAYSNMENEREVQQEKFQCETNGPSSSSNFHSKNSSSVKYSRFHPNEYQFGDYHKTFTPSMRSGVNEVKSTQSEDLLFEKAKSQVSKLDFCDKQVKIQQELRQTSKQDSELEIVQYALDFRVKKHSSLLLDEYNPNVQIVVNEQNEQNKVKQVQPFKVFGRKDSKIDELNNLIKEEDDLLIQISAVKMENNNPYQNTLSPENIQLARGQSDIVIQTSLQSQNSKQGSKISESQQSLQRVQIKKTHKSCQSDYNLFQHDHRQFLQKQSFMRGQFIFRSQPNYFQPLQFYASLVEKECDFKASITK